MWNNTITCTTAPTYEAVIHIAGSAAAARDSLREYVLKGLCVSLTEEDFIYTGGLEAGVAVRLINYPRFPASREAIEREALALAHFLIERLHQSSCCVVAPDYTHWLSRRAD